MRHREKENNLSCCEKCWGDAYLRWMRDPEKTQAEHYSDLLIERKDNHCTPYEQMYGHIMPERT